MVISLGPNAQNYLNHSNNFPNETIIPLEAVSRLFLNI